MVIIALIQSKHLILIHMLLQRLLSDLRKIQKKTELQVMEKYTSIFLMMMNSEVRM